MKQFVHVDWPNTLSTDSSLQEPLDLQKAAAELSQMSADLHSLVSQFRLAEKEPQRDKPEQNNKDGKFNENLESVAVAR
jgi:hypothetical protein